MRKRQNLLKRKPEIKKEKVKAVINWNLPFFCFSVCKSNLDLKLSGMLKYIMPYVDKKKLVFIITIWTNETPTETLEMFSAIHEPFYRRGPGRCRSASTSNQSFRIEFGSGGVVPTEQRHRLQHLSARSRASASRRHKMSDPDQIRFRRLPLCACGLCSVARWYSPFSDGIYLDGLWFELKF